MGWRISCLVLLAFISCEGPGRPASIFPDLMEVPTGFPEISFPEDNTFTEARWRLGKKLFYDPVMSVDSSLSCGSCHKQLLAFADNLAFSPGVMGRAGKSNSPSLANVAYHPYFTREGGVPTLEMQILVPIQEHNEFDFNILYIAERLARDSGYVRLAREAYNRPPDHFVITRALACFERSLLSGNSAYDRYVSRGDKNALDEEERAGMELFFSERSGCSSCHSGFNFSNYAFENNGLHETYVNPGRYRLTRKDEDKGKFKVPSLRNVGLTAPYMHDGSLMSLEAVIDHYQHGGYPHPNKSEKIQALDLTEEEKQQLVRFLHALSDYEFIDNPLFSN